MSPSPCSSPTASRSFIVSRFRHAAPCICALTIWKTRSRSARYRFSSVFESDVPIIVQHTRLDSRHAEVSLMSTTLTRTLKTRSMQRVHLRCLVFTE